MKNDYLERLRIKDIPKGLDGYFNKFLGLLSNRMPRHYGNMKKATAVLGYRDKISTLSDDSLKEKLEDFRVSQVRGRLKGESLIEAMACLCEASLRSKGMYPYPVQIAGVLSMLQGCIAEMATGEGKTLTSALAAVLLSWHGRGCHVLTSNNYLAERDAEEFRELFEFCGLEVSALQVDMSPDERIDAYMADITYCTNKDVAADFLRDQLTVGAKQTASRLLLKKIANHGRGSAHSTNLYLRGLDYVIVDEADSVMIDDGVTPLLISSNGGTSEEALIYMRAGVITDALLQEDYIVDRAARLIQLTEVGKEHVEKLLSPAIGVWSHKRRREELIVQALRARHFFLRDQHYILDDGKVVIVDEATGRTMPDRFWRNGMHQAVESKEGLEISPPRETCARISFQKFFRLYGFRCGMSGTASEAASEFWHFFRMPIVRIPTHRKCLRRFEGTSVFTNEGKKWQHVTKLVRRYQAEGRPVLVGVASIRASEALSAMLMEEGVDHAVLNARQHRQEAEIVSRAGCSGVVTVATNMAGRGTDIKLAASARESGGLVVVATEKFHSSRLDRQLFGRCSRQGDPGEVVCCLSMDDELVIQQAGYYRKLLKILVPLLPAICWNLVFAFLQKKAVRQSVKQRQSVLRNDEWLEDLLGFSGEGF